MLDPSKVPKYLNSQFIDNQIELQSLQNQAMKIQHQPPTIHWEEIICKTSYQILKYSSIHPKK